MNITKTNIFIPQNNTDASFTIRRNEYMKTNLIFWMYTFQKLNVSLF